MREFKEYLDTRLLVEKYNGICRASNWVNGMTKKRLPNLVIEKQNDGLPYDDIRADACVTAEKIIEFKEKTENFFVQKVIIYTGTPLDFAEVLDQRFYLTKKRADAYADFLFEIDFEKAKKFMTYSSDLLNYFKSKYVWLNNVETPTAEADFMFDVFDGYAFVD